MTEKTGTDVICDAVKLQVKRARYGRMAQEVGISNDTLLAFAEGRNELSDEVLGKLARELWQRTEFDAEKNLLVTKSRPLCAVAPTPYTPGPDSYDAVAVARAPRLTLGEKPKEKKCGRAR